MIGDDISAALPDMQEHAESLMVDLCEIRERSTSSTRNPVTNIVTPTPGALIYSGKCRVRQTAPEQVSDVAEQLVTTLAYRITVPWAVAGLRVDQLVTITSTADQQLTKPLTVIGVSGGSLRYHRLIICSYNLG